MTEGCYYQHQPLPKPGTKWRARLRAEGFAVLVDRLLELDAWPLRALLGRIDKFKHLEGKGLGAWLAATAPPTLYMIAPSGVLARLIQTVPTHSVAMTGVRYESPIELGKPKGT